MTRAIATCSAGHTTVLVVDWRTLTPEQDDLWQAYRRIQCRDCHRRPYAKLVQGKRGKRKCGPWCTEGIGEKCTCECGGVEHGSAWENSGLAGELWMAR